ncbi:MAG: MopE-related protein [Polyangiaceae bacterium]
MPAARAALWGGDNATSPEAGGANGAGGTAGEGGASGSSGSNGSSGAAGVGGVAGSAGSSGRRVHRSGGLRWQCRRCGKCRNERSRWLEWECWNERHSGAAGVGGSSGSGGVAGVGGVGGVGGSASCQDGDSQPCYTGPEGTEMIGACVPGTSVCSGGQFGPCMGEIVPSTEVCDNVDNDCNGLVDESDPSVGMGCTGSLPGVCTSGKFQCIAGGLTCISDESPGLASCDGMDNDCDGIVDNNPTDVGTPCPTNLLGVCADGTTSCSNAAIECVPNSDPTPEVCDGLDNNCDGQIDEGNPESGATCTASGALGECATGVLSCDSGSLVCHPSLPATEVCDGLDNNCDGQIDEGNPGGGASCGSCGAVLKCVNGQVTCVQPTVYFTEDFHDNSKGWLLDPTWQIGAAMSSSGGSGNPDPAQDHTATSDNGLAGVVIGGNAPTTVHDFYYLTSPVIDTSQASGSVFLSFWRFLNSDYTPYIENVVQVYNGTSWVDLPHGRTGGCCGVMDSTWVNHGAPNNVPALPTNSDQYPTQFELTAYKNAVMRVRFGYKIGSSGVYTIGGWNIDDVTIASAVCP